MVSTPDLHLMFNADTEPAFRSCCLNWHVRDMGALRLTRLSRQMADPHAGEPGASVVKGPLYALGSRSSAILVAAFPSGTSPSPSCTPDPKKLHPIQALADVIIMVVER